MHSKAYASICVIKTQSHMAPGSLTFHGQWLGPLGAIQGSLLRPPVLCILARPHGIRPLPIQAGERTFPLQRGQRSAVLSYIWKRGTHSRFRRLHYRGTLQTLHADFCTSIYLFIQQTTLVPAGHSARGREVNI